MPDDPDKMFVVDISTEVIEENGKPTAVFRIFISTTRLLTFTEYVSERIIKNIYILGCYYLLIYFRMTEY